MATPALGGQHFGSMLNMAMTQAQAKSASPASIKAKANAQDFEAVFLNSMFQHMMTGVEGDGPFGGSTGIGVWRSFLTNEFAKSVAQKGGIGLADQVYSSLIQQQAAGSNTASSTVAPTGVRKGDH
jgi:peptidoglycan hydrolase FlgJ